MIPLAALLNGLACLTLWLATPLVLRWAFRSRRADLQRMVTRTSLATAPAVFVIALIAGTQTQLSPLLSWTPMPSSAVAPEAPDSQPESREDGLAATPKNQTPAPSELESSPRPPVAPSSPYASRPERSKATTQSEIAHELRPASSSEMLSEADPSDAILSHPALRGSSFRRSEGVAGLPGTSHSWFELVVPILLALWFIGCSLGLFRWLHGQWLLRRLRSSWVPLTDATLAHVHELTSDSTNPLKIRVSSCTKLHEPIAIGTVRPTIAVPSSWVSELEKGTFDSVLLHELAHLRGHDPLWRTINELARAILWFHPFAHWSNRRERDLSELLADGAVLERGVARRDYARLLGNLALTHFNRPAVVPHASSVLGGRSQLEERLLMILDGRTPGPRLARLSRWSVRCFALLVLVGTATQPLIGQGQTPEVQVEVTQQSGWWVARGQLTNSPDDICWLVRLCPEESAQKIDVFREDPGQRVVLAAGRLSWMLDRTTGQLSRLEPQRATPPSASARSPFGRSATEPLVLSNPLHELQPDLAVDPALEHSIKALEVELVRLDRDSEVTHADAQRKFQSAVNQLQRAMDGRRNAERAARDAAFANARAKLDRERTEVAQQLDLLHARHAEATNALTIAKTDVQRRELAEQMRTLEATQRDLQAALERQEIERKRWLETEERRSAERRDTEDVELRNRLSELENQRDERRDRMLAEHHARRTELMHELEAVRSHRQRLRPKEGNETRRWSLLSESPQRPEAPPTDALEIRALIEEVEVLRAEVLRLRTALEPAPRTPSPEERGGR